MNESLNMKKRSQPTSVKATSTRKKSSLASHYDPPTPEPQKAGSSHVTSVHAIATVSQGNVSTKSPPTAPSKAPHALRGATPYAYNSVEAVPESALKSPTMLRAVFEEKDAVKKRAVRAFSPSLNLSLNMGHPDLVRNPFKFIENAIRDAKQKIQKMETPAILDQVPTRAEKKKLLNAENKLLRENLKKMSDNVNVLIEKMNQESLKKKPAPRPVPYGSDEGDSMSLAGSQVAILKPRENPRAHERNVSGVTRSQHSPTASTHRDLTERELKNDHKALRNLQREHKRLKERLDEVSQPDFLIKLKRERRTTEDEIKA